MLLLLACSAEDVTAEFEARKAAALGPPAPLEAGWEQEVVLLLGEEVVTRMVTGAVDAELAKAKPVDVAGVGKVKLKTTLEDLKLVKAQCDGCVGVRGRLEGTANFKVGKVKKTLPLTVKFKGQVEFASIDAGLRGRNLVMSLRKIQDLEVEVGSFGAQLGKPLRTWSQELLEEIEDVDLGPVGSKDLPLRDVRLQGSPQGLRIEALASCVEPCGTSVDPDWGGEGFQVVVSEGLLLDTARKTAFEEGDISGEHALDIWAEPTSLDVDGDRFEMELRLWRIEGSGWWRDYTLRGPLALERGHLKLSADELEEVDKSDGAAVVDPLAWLGEWLILDTMAESAHGAFPARDAFVVGDLQLTTTLKELNGEGDALVLAGDLAVHGLSKKK